MKPLVFVDLAEAEKDAAARFYQDREPGLGQSFLEEIQAAASWIAQHPEGWPLIDKNFRRCQLEGFPYYLIYRITSDYILVIHQKRRPDSWRKR